MAGGAAGGPVTSPKNDHHLGLYQELEIKLKTREMVIFVLEKKNNTKEALCMILATRFTFIVEGS